MKTDNKTLGNAGERLAADEYIRRGYSVLARQYAVRGVGEADLVCTDGRTIVFAEVKTRRSVRYGSPEEAVTHTKRMRLRLVAEDYLSRAGGADRFSVRFDVVAVTGTDGAYDVRVIENAF